MQLTQYLPALALLAAPILAYYAGDYYEGFDGLVARRSIDDQLNDLIARRSLDDHLDDLLYQRDLLDDEIKYLVVRGNHMSKGNEYKDEEPKFKIPRKPVANPDRLPSNPTPEEEYKRQKSITRKPVGSGSSKKN